MVLPLNPMDLHQLIESTNKIAQGDFSVRISPLEGNYPLNRLAENINQIAQLLESSHPCPIQQNDCVNAEKNRDKNPCSYSELQKQLFQAQKMESVGRLAGGIAHDFNNMLSVILGYSELMRIQLPNDNPLVPDILEIEKAATHSKETTKKLLAFSRKQVISPKALDLNKVVKNTISTLSPLVGENIDICFFPATAIWKIEFDPSQLEQILVNLVLNAGDAMPSGGKLTIETQNVTLDDGYCAAHIGSKLGNYVMLTVSDNGHRN